MRQTLTSISFCQSLLRTMERWGKPTEGPTSLLPPGHPVHVYCQRGQLLMLKSLRGFGYAWANLTDVSQVELDDSGKIIAIKPIQQFGTKFKAPALADPVLPIVTETPSSSTPQPPGREPSRAWYDVDGWPDHTYFPDRDKPAKLYITVR